MITIRTLAVTVAAVVALGIASADAADKKFVIIGTAGVSGGYYPAGGFTCNGLNKSRSQYNHNIRCTVESTAGSVANLRSVQSGDLDVAFSQADWQYHSWNGTSKFSDVGKNLDLRFLFSLQAEPMQIVTRKNTGIKTFLDLRGKVVNTGNVGSGTEATVYASLKLYGETAESFFKQETKLTSREQAQALCDGKIDAFFFPVAIGTSSIVEATNTCDATLADWDDDVIRKWVEATPYVAFYSIPADAYPGLDRDIKTWGMPATVVASAKADADVIYYMVKSVFDNFEDFKKQSAIFIGITREGAAKNGQTAPYHPGALRYFKEVKLLK